jgi:hypothetical protein
MRDIYKKKSKLSKREKRYCSCVFKLKLRNDINPYAICTSSVYNKQNKKRNKVVKCSENINYNKIDRTDLMKYARSKKLKFTSKISKKRLIKLITK